MELTSLDIRYIARECFAYAGGKVEKVYQGENKRDVYLVMYVPGQPKLHLRFLLPGLIFVAPHKPEYPQQPPGFAMFLRKHLVGMRLARTAQHGFDRILVMTFERQTQEETIALDLVVEFLPPGNMMLVSTNGASAGQIVNVLETQSYKDRQLRARQPYTAPPSEDWTRLTDQELFERIRSSTRKNIATTLAIMFNLGGTYAEEVCTRASVQRHSDTLNTEQITQLVAALRDILEMPLNPHKDDERAYPFAMESKTTHAVTGSFLQTVGTFVTDVVVQPREIERATKQTKLQRMIDAQGTQAEQMERDAVQQQRIAERIYEEYQLLSDILLAAKSAREHKDDVLDALNRFACVKRYDPATGTIELELEDA
jgi:predicted ribosome quality control (RQC) complex YloA/Tae2 family protein